MKAQFQLSFFVLILTHPYMDYGATHGRDWKKIRVLFDFSFQHHSISPEINCKRYVKELFIYQRNSAARTG